MSEHRPQWQSLSRRPSRVVSGLWKLRRKPAARITMTTQFASDHTCDYQQRDGLSSLIGLEAWMRQWNYEKECRDTEAKQWHCYKLRACNMSQDISMGVSTWESQAYSRDVNMQTASLSHKSRSRHSRPARSRDVCSTSFKKRTPWEPVIYHSFARSGCMHHIIVLSQICILYLQHGPIIWVSFLVYGRSIHGFDRIQLCAIWLSTWQRDDSCIHVWCLQVGKL